MSSRIFAVSLSTPTLAMHFFETSISEVYKKVWTYWAKDQTSVEFYDPIQATEWDEMLDAAEDGHYKEACERFCKLHNCSIYEACLDLTSPETPVWTIAVCDENQKEVFFAAVGEDEDVLLKEAENAFAQGKVPNVSTSWLFSKVVPAEAMT